MMRTESRVFAFKIIFSTLFESDAEEAKLNFGENLSFSEQDKDFANNILTEFISNKTVLEAELKTVLENYELGRIYKVDLALIYLGMTEIKYIKTPKPVVINEVLEIAKKFSTENSSKFINGVLAKIE
ncbi:MAG: transcription antitermination factor NusB [Clostridia bacterium]|nr:transcription antitermination factor NusB [Clostridia bacterium]